MALARMLCDGMPRLRRRHGGKPHAPKRISRIRNAAVKISPLLEQKMPRHRLSRTPAIRAHRVPASAFIVLANFIQREMKP